MWGVHLLASLRCRRPRNQIAICQMIPHIYTLSRRHFLMVKNELSLLRRRGNFLEIMQQHFTTTVYNIPSLLQWKKIDENCFWRKKGKARWTQRNRWPLLWRAFVIRPNTLDYTLSKLLRAPWALFGRQNAGTHLSTENLPVVGLLRFAYVA